MLERSHVSGAHFNPAVTVADAWQGGLKWRAVPVYVTAQVSGAFVGVMAAHLMFGEPLLSVSRHARHGPAQLFSEFVATFGLLVVIWGCSRRRSSDVAFAVGAYIASAYWFTASTSFANPAVTLARGFTDSFAGIRPADMPAFIVAQLTAGRIGRGSPRPVAVRAAVARACVHGDRAAAAREEGVMNTVIFACLHNAGRSQMAAAFFNQIADPSKARALSAGTRPAQRVHPEVLEVMREVGLDLSAARPQLLTTELAAGARHLVTMGCGEECPYLPGLEVHDWPLEDPKGKPTDGVRRIRDAVRERVSEFVRSEGWERFAARGSQAT